MKTTLEILRDTLLFGALIILIYVLYKRLLKVVGRENMLSKYPSLGNALTWTPDGKGLIRVDLAELMYLIVEIYDQQGNKIKLLEEGEYEAGERFFEFDKKVLNPGKYYYKVTSPKQEASQYFEVVH